MSRRIDRLLITGAAGRIGRSLRQRLAGDFSLIRLTDILPMEPAGAGEEVAVSDLADGPAMARLCEGIDAIIHLGGNPREVPWEETVPPNILGVINLWEGARKAGVDRVLYASSNHATGFYRRDDRLDHNSPSRPDGRYGLTKAFGEDLAQLYAYKYGVRGLMIRIGSFQPEPLDERMLATWLSHDDCERLIRNGLEADYTYEIVYGISRNTRAWWDNANAYRLGYDPRDDSERFAAAVVGKTTADPIAETFQGSVFASVEFSGPPTRVPPYERS